MNSIFNRAFDVADGDRYMVMTNWAVPRYTYMT